MLLEIGEGRTQKINGTNEIKIAENLERETHSAAGCSLDYKKNKYLFDSQVATCGRSVGIPH